MKDQLDKYRQKRDPQQTNEPFSAERSDRASSGETYAGRFVIHQHDASRMHFDLRLEVGGALQSFAVPRGISLDPKEKHLAMHTEAHPLEYLHFEAVIPEGNYGAGAMIVWDTGGVTYNETSAEQGIERGKIDFNLHGMKAQGRFALIATGRRKAATGLAGTRSAVAEWLLIKKSDAHSRSERALLAEELPESVLSGLTVKQLPRKQEIGREFVETCEKILAEIKPSAGPKKLTTTPVPMVCALEGAPLSSPDYLYELKLDGVRIIAEKSGDSAKLTYRTGRIATRNYADIARSVARLAPDELTLDGEIVTFDDLGRPNFQRLARRIAAKKPIDIQRAEASIPVVYLVFDLLRVGPHDLRPLPIEIRKSLLKRLLGPLGLVRGLDHIVEHGDALFSLCEQQGLEGMVAKRLGSPYLTGPQVSGHWVKIKREEEAEFVVVGYTHEKSDKTSLGALGLGSYVGDRLVYRGRVGSGLTQDQRKQLFQLFSEQRVSTSPVVQVSEDVPLILVRPDRIVRVKSHGFTEEGHLRAAVFLGLRADGDPRDCTRSPHDEYVEAPPSVSDWEEPTPTKLSSGRKVLVTNRQKIFWPEEGYTKGDLLDYYEAISDVMLPHLKDRPVVLVRYPDGIQGKSFYQWRAPEGTPDWIETFELYDEEKQQERGSGKAAFLVDSPEALLHIANLGCIPLHVLAGRRATREYCDFLTIDFDIADRPFKDAVLLALSLREITEDLGLSSYPKTSGQRGLHVLVPLGTHVPFESAKLLCELLGRVVVGRHHEIATMERRLEKRGDKVYVDTGQTGRSRTIVAPYSARAFPGARVSTPLLWREIHLALDPGVFTILTVPDRVKAMGDPMAHMLSEEPDLKSVLQKLATWTQSSP